MMYVRFALSLRNVEDLLHGCCIDICQEAVRYLWNRFGPLFARQIKKHRIDGLRYSHWRWHVDEVFVKINGKTHYLWWAVDHEEEELEAVVTKSRNKKVALKMLRKLLKRYGKPAECVTDKLPSYGAAGRSLGIEGKHVSDRYMNNRCENAHFPLRRRNICKESRKETWLPSSIRVLQ